MREPFQVKWKPQIAECCTCFNCLTLNPSTWEKWEKHPNKWQYHVHLGAALAWTLTQSVYWMETRQDCYWNWWKNTNHGRVYEPIKSRSHRSEAQRRKTRHNIMLTTWRLYSCLACRARWHRDGCQVWTRTPLCRSTHTANTRFPQGPVQHQYSV